jgi:4-hydroxybenzoate polyprenyltransferase
MRTFVQWLRLMRFPLVFTAIGDAWAVRFMAPDSGNPDQWLFGPPTVADLAILAGISFGLYVFGMVLNDVADARRDPPSKPIPSGAIGRPSAAIFAAGAAGGAIGLAILYGSFHPMHIFVMRMGGPSRTEDYSSIYAVIVAVVAGLILVYDIGGKRLPLLGLPLLGLIRAIHSQVSWTIIDWKGPGWNAVFLFAHVTIVSWIAYNWEGKRPSIGSVTRWALAFAVVLIAGILVDAFAVRPSSDPRIINLLLLPVTAAGVYLLILFWILASRRFPTGSDKGRAAMRIGLLWLLVYDAAFCAAMGRWTGVIAEAVLLACAILSSRVMMVLCRRAGLIAASRVEDTSESP